MIFSLLLFLIYLTLRCYSSF